MKFFVRVALRLVSTYNTEKTIMPIPICLSYKVVVSKIRILHNS